MTICARLAEWMELESYETDQGSFPNVTGDHWAARYVREASRNGWIVGCLDGLFHGRGRGHPRRDRRCQSDAGRTADETDIRRSQDELNTFHDLQPYYWA